MTVDDAVSIIITSGIATNSPESDEFRDLTDEEVAEVAALAGGPDGDGEEDDPRGGAAGADDGVGADDPGPTHDAADRSGGDEPSR
jgi:hypothetical protein